MKFRTGTRARTRVRRQARGRRRRRPIAQPGRCHLDRISRRLLRRKLLRRVPRLLLQLHHSGRSHVEQIHLRRPPGVRPRSPIRSRIAFLSIQSPRRPALVPEERHLARAAQKRRPEEYLLSDRPPRLTTRRPSNARNAGRRTIQPSGIASAVEESWRPCSMKRLRVQTKTGAQWAPVRFHATGGYFAAAFFAMRLL